MQTIKTINTTITLYEKLQNNEGYNLYIQNKNTFRKCNKKPIKNFSEIENDFPIELTTYINKCFTKRDFDKINILVDFLKTV